jgi:hypothetical protein
MLVTDRVDALIERLTDAGAKFKGDISETGAGRARLLEDSSGNLIEPFDFKKANATEHVRVTSAFHPFRP